MVNLSNIKSHRNLSPIHHINELMELRNWDRSKLAEKLNMSKTEMSELFDHDLPIGKKEAKSLESVFGISNEFWLNVDKNYRARK